MSGSATDWGVLRRKVQVMLPRQRGADLGRALRTCTDCSGPIEEPVCVGIMQGPRAGGGPAPAPTGSIAVLCESCFVSFAETVERTAHYMRAGVTRAQLLVLVDAEDGWGDSAGTRASATRSLRSESELAAELLDLLEHQRECTAPDLVRPAQIRAVLEWVRQGGTGPGAAAAPSRPGADSDAGSDKKCSVK